MFNYGDIIEYVDGTYDENFNNARKWANSNQATFNELIDRRKEIDGVLHRFYEIKEIIVPVPIPQTKEEIRQARESAYRAEVDSPLMAEYNRKKTFNLFEEGEEEKLLAEITAKVEEIKTRFPYPNKPVEEIEELPVVEEEVVSKMENVQETEEVI